MPDFRIRRALVAVYDKTGIVEFARALVDEFGIEIISTGGTAKHVKQHGIPVTLVETITGFPEMLDGRVKTLHPKIHAAILADRDNPEHMKQLAEQGIEPIDMVVVNLYPFEKTVADPNCTLEEAIEMIDIGGPCLLRAAAKNHRHVWTICEPRLCNEFLAIMREKESESRFTDDEMACTRRTFAGVAYRMTCEYDRNIQAYFVRTLARETPTDFGQPGSLPPSVSSGVTKLVSELRYGENPHQPAGVYAALQPRSGLLRESALQGEMSFNNYLDADAALGLCAELTRETHQGLPRPEEPRPSGRAAAESSDALAGKEEPRPSGRAAAVPRNAPEASSPALAPPDPGSPAWLLTWTTYGSWLPGDERGFVSRAPRQDGAHDIRSDPKTPYDADQPDLEEAAKSRMSGPGVTLDSDHARVAAEAMIETAHTHHINLIAFSIMADHVHLLCQARQDGSELLNLFKGVCSRRLSQYFSLGSSPRWWTKSGSKQYIKMGIDLSGAIEYVANQKRTLLCRRFDRSLDGSQTDLRTAARPEGRGSSFSAIAVFVKHANPCGVGISQDPIEAYRRAYLGDPNAAMGGILAVNFAVDASFAEVVMETLDRWGKNAGAGALFIEVWLAPSFDEAAVEAIRSRKKWGEKVRLLAVGEMSRKPDPNELVYRGISGGFLVQTKDLLGLNEEQWKVVTKRPPTESELPDLRLAWLIAKHTKSNAISIVKDGMLLGNGAGQMSRVMSCRIAAWLAKDNGHASRLAGSAAASDAFFPFRDGPDQLLDAGVTAVIQPGGSKRYAETIAACDERGAAMIFTGTRHFRH